MLQGANRCSGNLGYLAYLFRLYETLIGKVNESRLRLGQARYCSINEVVYMIIFSGESSQLCIGIWCVLGDMTYETLMGYGVLCVLGISLPVWVSPHR